MSTITVTSLSAHYGARTLFDGLNLVIDSGHRWGLTGPNGAGQSTVLSALAGAPGAAEIRGTIRRSPHDMTVGFLHQEIQRRVESVSEFIARRTGVAAAQHDMERYAAAMAAGDDTVDDAYSDALNTWLALGGADFEERYAHVAARLGLTVDEALPMSALSGGQAARVNLAVILLSSHDVLLLDEPTNDLDLEGLEILEAFVLSDHRPMMIVSHDREFLACTVTGVVELDSAQQQITVYEGGWESYLVERARARAQARADYEEYAAKIAGLKERVQTQKTWLDRGTKNAIRRAPDNDKHIRHRAGQRSEKQAAKIAQSQRAMKRVEEVAEPRKEWILQMDIAAAPRSGTVVSSVRDAVVCAGDFQLGPVTLQINYGDRVLINGANGAGKSMLLRLMLDPDNLGAGVRVGEVDQARAVVSGERTLLDALSSELPDLSPSELRTVVAKFGLRDDHVTRPCAALSPGERTRAALALLQVRGTNVLVLDEPTNHLDLPAIEQLEEATDRFSGTVLLVTHDRRMRDGFRATRVLTVAAGQVTEDG
ncbi:ABC-F family ATP-binding cassette domain-containing protein [Corynebacterium sp. P5848]|uniref:ABC-F family ATP-binding cassette domain-containing protein n=1 Tax=Corynebacterium marambiense TaxID=2765364 RepID=UPI002260E930|nr:ABC-F family ATP-binding cassette domain-containing protein [Corynebacterium marambiense]MCX7542576.1 ABC-F family ATP-binding cassette domain-containing protein [Corynebacterium marambiense]